MILNPKETLARDLFFQTGKTQKEIAQIIGVSEKTIYLWMRDGDWKRLRSASKRMPSMIVENFYSQVQELNEEIRSRDTGKRYPTIQEAEVFRKMVMTIGRIQKGHTQPEYMEMMQKFLSWVMSQDHTLSKTLTPIANAFLKTQSVDGFLPFDIEYEPAPPKDEPNTIDFHAAEFTNNTSLSGACPANSGREGRGEAELAPVTPEDSNNNSSQVPGGGRGQLAPDTPDDNNNISLSFGEGRGEAELAPVTPEDSNNTSSPSERPGEVSAPPLFLKVVPGGGRGQLAPDTPDDNDNISLSFVEGRAEAKQDDNSTFCSIEEDKPEAKPETTRNETITSYDNIHAPSGEPPLKKPEIENEPEIGNQPDPPISPLGAGVHIPGITYRDNDGQLKLIPPYKSKEYWDLPGNIRERLYTMGGDPISDRKVSNYF